MTVCIAAICDNGATAVAASDRMLQATYPPIEFEHTKPKIHYLSKYCIALTAGDALKPIEIIPDCILTIENQKKSPQIKQIVEIVKSWYQLSRLSRVEEQFLKPRTISIQTFYEKGMRILPIDIFGYLDKEITSYDYGLQLMVVGGDDSGAHIYALYNPGIANCYDTISFHAIGIGQLYAMEKFVAQKYSSSCELTECLNVVYAAKKAAEAAPGVGKETDISIIDKNQAIMVDDAIIQQLESIYATVTGPRQEEIQKAKGLLEALLKDRKGGDNNGT
ncbi:MAG: hypothetical protein NTY36_00445 [Deltaproteobacteria bacterium]|nr:hypothetical protein [Deltaproteobacteria bacterium]